MSENSAHATVVIPLYNKATTIVRTLESVFGQSVTPDEVLIVNDGSTDNGPQIVEEFIRDKPAARLIHIENQGVSVARNTGIEQARNEFVLMLDADDFWMKHHYDSCCRMFASHPECGIYFSGSIKKSGNPEQEEGSTGDLVVHSPGDFIEFFRNKPKAVHTSSVGLHRERALQSGGFPAGGIRSQDIFLWLVIGSNFPACQHKGITAIQLLDELGLGRRSAHIPCTLSQSDSLYEKVPSSRHKLLNKILRRNAITTWLASHSRNTDISGQLSGALRSRQPLLSLFFRITGLPLIQSICRVLAKMVLKLFGSPH